MCSKLWESIGGLEAAQRTFKRIVEYVDVLIGNEDDLQMGLGVKGPDVEKKSKLDTSVFFEMIAEVNRDFPDVKMVATTLREVETANRHQWGAVARLGWAHGALSTTFPGDVTMARLAEVEAFAKGGSARVQRWPDGW